MRCDTAYETAPALWHCLRWPVAPVCGAGGEGRPQTLGKRHQTFGAFVCVVTPPTKQRQRCGIAYVGPWRPCAALAGRCALKPSGAPPDLRSLRMRCDTAYETAPALWHCIRWPVARVCGAGGEVRTQTLGSATKPRAGGSTFAGTGWRSEGAFAGWHIRCFRPVPEGSERRMIQRPPLPDPRIISYQTLRRAVGFIGVGLPFVLALGDILIFHGDGVRRSVSSYYHTPMRGVLVGALWAIGVFLFAYKGYDR